MNQNNRGMVMRRVGGDDNQQNQAAQRVEVKLSEPEPLWQKQEAPAREVYDALREAVLPETRTTEVFLYPRPLANVAHNDPLGPAGIMHPKSVGAMLARWAVRAERVDGLRQHIDARKGQPLAELPALILSGLIALETNDNAAVAKNLEAIDQRRAKDTLQHTAEMACHVALPTLLTAEDGNAALPIIEKAVKNRGNTPAADRHLAARDGPLLLRKRSRRREKELQEYPTTIERIFARYGDYPIYRREIALQQAAAVQVRAAKWSDALETLGQYADTPAYRESGPAIGPVFGTLRRQMAVIYCKYVYYIFEPWTMPKADRKLVRLLVAFVPDAARPEPEPALPTIGRLACSRALRRSSRLEAGEPAPIPPAVTRRRQCRV